MVTLDQHHGLNDAQDDEEWEDAGAYEEGSVGRLWHPFHVESCCHIISTSCRSWHEETKDEAERLHDAEEAYDPTLVAQVDVVVFDQVRIKDDHSADESGAEAIVQCLDH